MVYTETIHIWDDDESHDSSIFVAPNGSLRETPGDLGHLGLRKPSPNEDFIDPDGI